MRKTTYQKEVQLLISSVNKNFDKILILVAKIEGAHNRNIKPLKAFVDDKNRKETRKMWEALSPMVELESFQKNLLRYAKENMPTFLRKRKRRV